MKGLVKVKASYRMPHTVAIVVTAFAILVIDALVDVDIDIPVLYVAVVLMSARVYERRGIVSVALVCILVYRGGLCGIAWKPVGNDGYRQPFSRLFGNRHHDFPCFERSFGTQAA
jgi:hypothetical protein